MHPDSTGVHLKVLLEFRKENFPQKEYIEKDFILSGKGDLSNILQNSWVQIRIRRKEAVALQICSLQLRENKTKQNLVLPEMPFYTTVSVAEIQSLQEIMSNFRQRDTNMLAPSEHGFFFHSGQILHSSPRFEKKQFGNCSDVPKPNNCKLTFSHPEPTARSTLQHLLSFYTGILKRLCLSTS